MENLFSQTTGLAPADPTEDKVPSFLAGADLHNIGNNNTSWFDPTTWGERLENGGKFAAVSILSGGSQLFNSGVAIGNFFGADIAETTTQDIITGIDSNLGDYYSHNRQSADLVGFIATSLLPGIGGIKLFNAGQAALSGALKTGTIGRNIAEATGLLVPKTATYIAGAAHDINAASATFSAITQNGIKALMSGARQQVLEGMAFEIAVQATMFKSPILDGQSTSDIVKNVMLAGALGGVVGGALEGAGTYFKIQKAVKGFEAEAKFSSARALQQELGRPDLNIIRNAQDLESAAQVIKPAADAAPEELALYQTLVKNTEQRTSRILNDMRENTNALARGGDTSATNMLADSMVGASSDQVMEGFLHATEIVRPGILTKVEAEISKAIKAKGVVDPGLQVNYVKLTGEGAGAVVDGEPLILSIADKIGLRKGQSIEDGVMAKVGSYKFKPTTLWDAATKAGLTSHTEAEARYIWASRLKELPESIHINDIPLLEQMWERNALGVKLVDNSGAIRQEGFASRDELWKYIKETKESTANSLMLKRAFKDGEDVDLVAQAVGKIVNTKTSRLDGTLLKDETKDYLANQAAKEDYAAGKIAKGLPGADVDPAFLPSYAKVARVVPESAMADVTGHVLDGAAWIKTQEKFAQDAVNNAVAKSMGDLYGLVPEIPESQVWQANRGGAGAKIAAFASGSYGSLESTVQSLGSTTQKLKTAFRQTTSDTLQGPLAALGRNQEAAIEFSTVNQKVTRSGTQWVRHTGEEGELLVTQEAKKALMEAEAGGEAISLDATNSISLKSVETVNAVDAMIARSSTRQESYSELRAAQGKVDAKDPAVYRPTRPNPKDYPFFAFVKDEKVVGQGHTTMIFANTPAKLQEMGNNVEKAGLKVHYKQDTEDFFKAYGDYEYSRTLNESYIDSTLKNKGIYSEHFTKTDPQKIVNDVVQQHLREDDVLAMELMRAKNQKAFDFLEDQGKAYTRVESSTLGRTSASQLESAGKNPYLDYIKTALDISKAPESQMLYSFNKFLDTSVSKAVGAVKDVLAGAKTPDQISAIQGLLDKYGMKNSYHDAAVDLLANHTAPRGELTKFVRTANSIMSTFTLGLDPLNSLVNAIGANVLRGTEMKQLTDAINAGDKELAGKLADLAKIDVTGKGDMILSPLKLYGQAQKNFFEDWKSGRTLLKQYEAAGYVTGDAAKFHNMLDDVALKGTETVQDLTTRTNRIFATAKELSEAGKKLTGNKFAEDYNRFISANVMDQITGLAKDSGLLTDAESHSYINTFVNRVEGNTVASQRPLMFQGPLGNAIGLFQSYQFNMMQNLFRYTAEGTGKDAAMLLGLQGTFFGLNGLPGFQFINQHVVGTLSGNKNHVDLYDATYGAAGKQMGDLLMYGLPSDLLRTNLYSRGDINPRSLTIVPSQIKDIPAVSGFMSVVGNVLETLGKVGGGANAASSFLQGLEHNGISRPLAGMAQVLEAAGPSGQVYSTTSKGSILFSNDLLSMATLSRLAGGRPLDEALVNDGVFRIHSYSQYDHSKMNALAEKVKTSTIAGQTMDGDQMSQFAAEYAKNGGKQQGFNKWVLNEMKNANINEASKIKAQLQNPFAQKVQILMGGAGQSDFTNQ